MDIKLELQWSLGQADAAEVIDPLVFTLLRGVRQGGHLIYAAREAGVSYRHAWGLLRTWESRLGKPLLITRQGRGARLTALGERLLAIVQETTASLTGALDSAALQAAAQLAEALDPRRHPLHLAASHGAQVSALRDALATRHRVQLEIVGSSAALARYRRGDADIAVFHLPHGTLGRSVAAPLIAELDPQRDSIFLLEKRVLGLMSRPDLPCRELVALTGGQLRFVNRQPGSGTRLVFDALLAEAGLEAAAVRGYADEEYTHTAVAALVAAGHADVAFGTEQAATALALHFAPLVDERCYAVVSRRADAALKRMLADFCAGRPFAERERMKADEFTPTVAALKRIHRAGFWKPVATRG